MTGNPFLASALEKGMRAQMEAWRFMYPDQYSSIMNELTSMDRESCVARLRQAAAERGIDLEKLASQYGVNL